MTNLPDTQYPNDLCFVEFRSFDGYRKVYSLNKSRLTIGIHGDADISFPGLQFNHAELIFDNEAWVIRKSNSGAVLTFQSHPVQIKKLNPGDTLFLGTGRLIFRGDSRDKDVSTTGLIPSSVSSPPFRLTVLNGREKNRSIDLHPGEHILGRLDDNEESVSGNRIGFCNRFVSRDHARLYVENIRLIIEDLNSTNGTRINRKRRITGELKNGDVVRIGKLKLSVSCANTLSRPTELIDCRLKRFNQRLLTIAGLAAGLALVALVLYLTRAA